MVRKIIFNSVNDDANLINGSNFNSKGANQIIQNDRAIFNSIDDCNIEIPSGSYDSLIVSTTNGDVNIDLPNCHFNKITLNTVNGDIYLSTSFDDIITNTVNGDIETRNIEMEIDDDYEDDFYSYEPETPSIRKATSSKSQFKEPKKKNNRDRYF